MLDVEVNQVVEDLDVRHFDTRVLSQCLTNQINVLTHVHGDAFGCHYLDRARKRSKHTPMTKAMITAQPATLVACLGIILNLLVI